MCRYRAHSLVADRLGDQTGVLFADAAPGDIVAFSGPDAPKHYPPDLSIEPRHMAMALEIHIAAKKLKGEVVIDLVSLTAGPRTLSLDGVDFHDVDVHDVGGKALHWSYDGKKIAVVWDDPFETGEQRQLKVTWRVENPASGLFFMHPTPDEPTRPLYAHTDHETELARHWLPCVDLPAVRTTLEFQLNVEQSHTALANGRLVSEKPAGKGRKTVTWRLDQKCPSYLICFAVGDFVRFDDGEFEGVELSYFASRQFTPEDLRRAFGRTGKMLEWMTRKLGMRFPWPKYHQFALPSIGGAMENISLVSWNDIFVLDEAHAKEWTWVVDQINIHEMAHTWFGDLVVCRDFAHAWLKESWATYMEQCWLEDQYGEDEARHDFLRCADAYFEESDESWSRPIVNRVFKSSWQMYDRHLYPGGACRLHTLRKELGDEVFWPAVTDYLKTWAGLVVETEDFRRVLEKHSGRSLVKFFEQWFYTAGYPDIEVTFEWDGKAKLGRFTIEQKQVAAGKIPFELSTDVGWTIGGKDFYAAVSLKGARHEINVPMDRDPEMVRFDPHCKVLHKLSFNPGQSRLITQLTKASDVIGRIQAARELCKTAKNKAVRAVAEAWKTEKFWGVRRAMGQALCKVHTEEAVAALAEIVREEKDPLVLDMGVAQWVGAYRDERICAALIDRLSRKDLPPSVEASFVSALGWQRSKTHDTFAVIGARARAYDKYGFVQSAAFKAAAATRRDEAAQLLVDASESKIQFRARPAIAMAMGSLAPWSERRDRSLLVEKLEDMLLDREAPVRMAAARALRTAEAKEALPLLETFRETLSVQEGVAVEKLIRGLRSAEDPKVSGLRRQLDELEERFRKVEVRLGKVEEPSPVVRAAGRKKSATKRPKKKTARR